MGISRIFDISRRSLASYQRALDVSSHNIANAANPNYSRQRVIFNTETPEINAGMIWGTGVKLENIFRVKNNLIQSQIINNNPKYSYNEKQSSLLGQIEEVYSEPSELGLSSMINKFFNSWNELSVTPNSTPLRNNVIYATQKLTAKIDGIKESYEIIKSDVVSEFKDEISQVNDYLTQIQNLNVKIYEAKNIGTQPNDFLDERDRLINELSEKVNIRVSYDDKDVATISIGGVFAVDGTTNIKFEYYEKDGELAMRSGADGNLAAINSGEINALKDIYSNKIPAYEKQLNNIINAIKTEVNNLHSSGYSLEDPPDTGILFFQEGEPGELRINQNIINDPNKIAVSEDGSSGNAAIAIKLAEISNKKVLNNLTISENYATLISGIANNKQSAENMAATDRMVLDHLELQKASYSGVSIDEEMTNIIKFQRSYDASAKLIKIADEMLQTILSIV